MVTIQEAVGADACGIQEVYLRTFLQIYPNQELGITRTDVEKMFEDAFSVESVEKRAAQIDQKQKNTLFLTAKDETVVVGICVASIKEDINQLQSIYLLPEYQNKGIGKQFWAEILSFFGDNKDIVVHVATYNEQAIKFYENLGFVDTGKRFSEERHRMPLSKILIPEMEMVYKKATRA